MNLIYQGKTKDLFKLEDGNILFRFKDDITGEDGKADTGGDEVVGSIEGLGNKNLILSKYYFELLEKNNIPSHFVEADLEENTMTVKEAKFFGQGLEIITRYKAVGSFYRRYGLYVEDGQDLDEYVEFTLKDDERKDPLITKEALEKIHILEKGQYEEIEELNRKCAQLIKEDLEKLGLELYDIKLEFGLVDGEIVVIDEISGGNMRVYKGDSYIEPDSLIDYFNFSL